MPKLVKILYYLLITKHLDLLIAKLVWTKRLLDELHIFNDVPWALNVCELTKTLF